MAVSPLVGQGYSSGSGGEGHPSKGKDWIRKDSCVSLLPINSSLMCTHTLVSEPDPSHREEEGSGASACI